MSDHQPEIMVKAIEFAFAFAVADPSIEEAKQVLGVERSSAYRWRRALRAAKAKQRAELSLTNPRQVRTL